MHIVVQICFEMVKLSDFPVYKNENLCKIELFIQKLITVEFTHINVYKFTIFTRSILTYTLIAYKLKLKKYSRLIHFH